MEREALIRDLERATGAALTHAPVEFGYLFGSHATGRARPGSDVDVAVFLDEKVDPDRYLDLSLELARRLSDASAFGGIEVTVLNDAPLPVRGRAVSERVVLYARDESSRVRFEKTTLKEYLDFKIHSEELARTILTQTAEGTR